MESLGYVCAEEIWLVVIDITYTNGAFTYL